MPIPPTISISRRKRMTGTASTPDSSRANLKALSEQRWTVNRARAVVDLIRVDILNLKRLES
jgi:hypothetical protein